MVFRYILLGLFLLGSCQNSQETTPIDDIVIEILHPGKGEVDVKSGDKIQVIEETKYLDGRVLFHTDSIGGSLSFLVGADHVIAGLDRGVLGMKIGEIRKITIPPHLSERSDYPEFIHPDSTLVYTVELLDILEQGQ